MNDKNNKSEVIVGNRKRLPILTPGIGSRIEKVSKMLGGNAAAARAAYKSDIQIGRYIREMSTPTVDVIVALAQAAGVSIEWLATGVHSAGQEDQASTGHQLSENLGTYYSPKSQAAPSVALYARLVGPVHDLVKEESEREGIMVRTLEILATAARDDNQVLNEFKTEDLRAAVGLAMATKRIEEGES